MIIRCSRSPTRSSPPFDAGLRHEAAIRMAISTACKALAGIEGKLDPRWWSTARCFDARARSFRRWCRPGGPCILR